MKSRKNRMKRGGAAASHPMYGQPRNATLTGTGTRPQLRATIYPKIFYVTEPVTSPNGMGYSNYATTIPADTDDLSIFTIKAFGGSKRKSRKSRKTKKGRGAHEGGKKKCHKHCRRHMRRTRKG